MSELRAMLEETVTRLFTERVTKERIEAAEGGAWQADLWRAVEEGGLTRPHLPEAAGGAGGSWLEAYTIVRASGRHTVPLPLAETVLASWLLAAAKIDVPDGPLTIVPVPIDAGCVRGGSLSLEARDVPWARVADHVVFAGADGETTRVGLVTRGAGVEVRHAENLAREPRDTLAFSSAPVLALEPAPLPADAARLYGALVRSAQMAGAMEAMLAQAVQYAGERVQFGRPIGKFQVIQHELAKLAGDVAAASIAAETAFAAAAGREAREFTSRADAHREAEPSGGRTEWDPRFEIAVAKTRIGDTVDQATSIAHQVHGAIGFTYEHGLHFATRRLWSWRAEFGSDAFWAAELGRAALARGADALWPYLTSR